VLTGLPFLFRMLKYKATASASTITPRWTNVTGAAVGAAGDLGSSLVTAAQVNTEQNLLVDLTDVGGSFFYKDTLTTGTATTVHRMIIKEGP
jgi:hypothetical protein